MNKLGSLWKLVLCFDEDILRVFELFSCIVFELTNRATSCGTNNPIQGKAL